MNNKHTGVDLKSVKLLAGLWEDRNRLLAHAIIPYQWDTLNNRTKDVPLSHAVENFRIAAREMEGEPEGTIFQDSDVAKWIEAAAYSLVFSPNEALENTIDELVRLIEKSQHSNGYVNTYYTAKGIEQRWTDLAMGHELYCAGHLMEASVAYYQVTGKRKLMDVMIRYADLITEEFGVEEGKLHAYDGHPEIELALYRLADASGDDRYKDLADYFMNIRGVPQKDGTGSIAKEGKKPKTRWLDSDYLIADKPIREMDTVTGHAVRAVYLYAGIADQYRRTREPELWETLKLLWDNLEQKRIYITGGIGSQSHGERFTVDYDLPPDRGYTETCASIGVVFWAWRMSLIDADSRYADMVEKEIYNGALSGISLDGKNYFYVNPLETKPQITAYRQDMEHVLTHRVGWFDCACCPTNIARLIGSIGSYLYSVSGTRLYVHQYIASEVDLMVEGSRFLLRQTTTYPWDGDIRFSLEMAEPQRFSLLLRKPGWCDGWEIRINGIKDDTYALEEGYIVLDRMWTTSDTVAVLFEMPVRVVQADSRVQAYCGKAALMRGPLVYCLEEFDNGPELQELLLDPQGSFELGKETIQSVSATCILFDGYRETISLDSLYAPMKERQRSKVRLKAIPYFQWGNRGKDEEMRVWLRSL